ncbi:MAG: hypothetical protein HFJ04_14150 [Lachnospiraceae bacterium]|nr:hypothetical protein [Lachnospiraceae bacterium]
MGCLEELIDNEFSVGVISVLNYRLDEIGALVSEYMDAGAYKEAEDRISGLLVDISKEFFTQGFLRGIAVARCGAL